MKSNVRNEGPSTKQAQSGPANVNTVNSLLDVMRDGMEYHSVSSCNAVNIDLNSEIRRAIHDISVIRNRPVLCYLANVVNPQIKASTSINLTDDLPFSEMVDKVNSDNKNVDIILVTPGGSAEQVAKFVNKLRPRFDSVGFILPFIAMSAGTIFCLSGDEVIMDSRAYIGPIDPQVVARDGNYVPAQSIFELINDIKERGKEALSKGGKPDWTDLQILNNIDGKQLGNAISASNFSIELVTNYLATYKFKNWCNHRRTTGALVTQEDKNQRANEIASQLCSHSLWKTHSRGITREMAANECQLEIMHPEQTDGLQRAIRRFWALIYWAFERTNITKIFFSAEYNLFRSDLSQMNNNKNNL